MYTDVYIHVKIYTAYMHSLESILSGSFGTMLDFKGVVSTQLKSANMLSIPH